MIWPISLLTRTEKGSRLNKEEFDDNYTKIAEGLNTLYDLKLEKTATAADSAKLGGVELDRIVYGSNRRATSGAVTDCNAILKSGIYYVSSGAVLNRPVSAAGTLLHQQHETLDNHSTQLYIPFDSAIALYVRRQFSGTWGGWTQVFSTGTAVPNIKFSNTPSADNAALDWYEEGTFTPVFAGTTGAGVAVYSKQRGTYTRVGNIVKLSIGLEGTFSTPPAGTPIITGLPFLSSSSAFYFEIGNMSYGFCVPSLVPYIQPSSTGIRILKRSDVLSSNSATASFGSDYSDTRFNMYITISYAV